MQFDFVTLSQKRQIHFIQDEELTLILKLMNHDISAVG